MYNVKYYYYYYYYYYYTYIIILLRSLGREKFRIYFIV